MPMPVKLSLISSEEVASCLSFTLTVSNQAAYDLACSDRKFEGLLDTLKAKCTRPMDLTSGLEHIVRRDEPLSRHTWFRMGGLADYFVEPTTVDELSVLVTRCGQNQVPIKLLGAGSNVLISDDGFRGVVIRLAAPAFCSIETDGCLVTAGGGASLAHVISTAVREGLGGLESLVGIPGTIGGALHGNSGRQHADIGPATHGAKVLTRAGEVHWRSRDELVFAYRQSSLDELAILEAQFQLERADSGELTKQMQKLWIMAKSSQPTGDWGVGRMFKNSHGVRAADLIEQVGMKGTQLGGASISDKNSNYVIVDSTASSSDVLNLMEQIQERIDLQLGIQLDREIDVW